MQDYIIAGLIILAVGVVICLVVGRKKDESGATRRAGNGDGKGRH